MNEIEKQILNNQLGIINAINHIMVRTCPNESGDFQRDLIGLYNYTKDLLNPPKQPTIAERTHDAFCESSEVKKE